MEKSHKIPRQTFSDGKYSKLFILLLMLIIFFSDNGQISGDGTLRWEALRELMDNHHLTPDKYSIIQPLAAAPLFVIGDLYVKAKRLFRQGESTDVDSAYRLKIIKGVVQRFNKFIILFIALWFYRYLKKGLAWSRERASLATLFLLWGSLLIPHARDFYSECLWTGLSLAALTIWSSIWGLSGRRIPKFTIISFIIITSLLIPLNPTLVIVLGGMAVIISLGRLWISRRPGKTLNLGTVLKPDMLLLTVSISAGILLCFLENYLRRGRVTDFGYTGEGFTVPFASGFFGLLISPTRGILFFIPTFFCGFWLLFDRDILNKNESNKVFILLSLLYSAILPCAYAKWHTWHGGWYWGPRFLLPLSILGSLYYVILLKEKWKTSRHAVKSLLLSLGVCSFLVYKVGTTINQSHLLDCLRLNPQNELSYFWSFRFLPYASYLNKKDLSELLWHRSTVVELIGIILFLILIQFSQRSKSP